MDVSHAANNNFCKTEHSVLSNNLGEGGEKKEKREEKAALQYLTYAKLK